MQLILVILSWEMVSSTTLHKGVQTPAYDL